MRKNVRFKFIFFQREYIKFFAIVLFAATLPSVSHARWAKDEDADSITEYEKIQFEINKDGSFVQVIEKSEKVLKESGRTQIGTLRLGYSPTSSLLKVLEAKTINDGVEISLDSKYIQDKPVSLEEHGFDNQNQLVCAFNDVRIGSIVSTKIRRTVHKPSFAGIFSDRQILGNEAPLKSGKYIYTSSIPIYIEVNDPDHNLEITNKQSRNKFVITVNIKSMIFKKVVDEDGQLLNFYKRTWFVVSSSTSYSDIATSVIDRYEEILNAALPPAFEKILNLAKAKKSSLDQIDTVTSELASMMRYVGDWREVDGGYIPRPLSVIEKSMFGDCKDFSTVTAAILRKLNINANIAFVERNQVGHPLSKLTFGAFNHAIVNVKLGNEILWIDPTNLASFARGTFEDILDRKALVISRNDPGLYDIPVGKPQDSMMEKNIISKIYADGTEEDQFNLSSKGRKGSDITGAALQVSSESIENALLGSVTNYDGILEHKFAPFNLASRIVSDLKFRFWVKQNSRSINTTLGQALEIKSPRPVKSLLSLQARSRVSDYFLTYPMIYLDSRSFENISVLGKKTGECKLDSPWLKTSRKFERIKNRIIISDETIVKKAIITSEEMQSPEFINLRSSLKKCFEDQYVIYKMGSDGPSLRKPAGKAKSP